MINHEKLTRRIISASLAVGLAIGALACTSSEQPQKTAHKTQQEIADMHGLKSINLIGPAKNERNGTNARNSGPEAIVMVKGGEATIAKGSAFIIDCMLLPSDPNSEISSPSLLVEVNDAKSGLPTTGVVELEGQLAKDAGDTRALVTVPFCSD